MPKVTLSLAAIWLLSITVAAQPAERSRFFCGYGEGGRGAELCAKIQASSYATDEAAERAVDKVLRPLGLKRNFVLIPCPDINNAAAVTYNDGVRYIIYDREFMGRIDRRSNTEWGPLSILAHELGHHLQGHTTRFMSFPPSREDLRQSRERELEADEFSGFVMRKLRASLAQAQSAAHNLNDVGDEELSTHPKRWRRLEAIETGYRAAEAEQPLENIDRQPSAEEFFSKAFAAYEKKNYRETIDSYTVAIGLKPDYAFAYFNRGVAKREGSKDYKGAIEDHTEAIRLRPGFAEAYHGRGVARHDNKDYKGAIEDYTEAIRLKPNYAEVYYGRGVARQFGNKDYKGAIEDYTEAIRLKPDHASAYYNRGISRDDNKDYKGAIEDYTEAIRLKPDHASAYYNRGVAKRVGNKDHKGAIEDYTEAIRLAPDDPDGYFARGNARQFGNKDHKGAIEDYTEAIRLKPDHASAYQNRGISKSNLNDATGACEDFRKACQMGSSGACGAASSCK